MDKYLQEILKEVNTIIIPGLGALTITNSDTGEIMFMSYLKHDDGKLTAHIAEKEGMDENEAKNLIAKYVREITTKLDQGESYDMFQFGSFVKDGDDIDFRNAADDLPVDDAKTSTKEEEEKPAVAEKPKKAPAKKTAAKAKTETTKKADSKKEDEVKKEAPKSTAKKSTTTKKPSETKKEAEKPTAKVTPKKTEKPEATKDETKETSKTPPIIPISKGEEKKETSKTVAASKELNIAEKEERAANEKKLATLKKQKEEEPKKKRSLGFWILIVLIFIIVGGGVTVGIFYEDVKQHIPFLADNEEQVDEDNPMDEMMETLGLDQNETEDESDNEEIIEEENEVSEESSEEEQEEVIEEPIVEEPVEETPVVTQSGNLPFHLIAGSFSSEANANRMVDKLKSEGFPAQVLFGGGLHMVSVKAFASRADAEAGRADVSGSAPKAWVLKWQ